MNGKKKTAVWILSAIMAMALAGIPAYAQEVQLPETGAEESVMMQEIAPKVQETAAAAEEIPLDAAHFPDANFRYEITKHDTDKNGSLSVAERSQVISIDVQKHWISSLKGIEYFTNLETLDCYNNQIKELDVSKCTQLKTLSCGNNYLTSLNVSGCTKLQLLSCRQNKLETLNVSRCTMLQKLRCGYNRLKTLDVSGFKKLEELYCDYNALTTLNISGCTGLKKLYCENNRLTSLDVGECTALKQLSCPDNKLTALDVSRCKMLVSIWCDRNKLTALDVSGCTELSALQCDFNELTQLKVSGLESLRLLQCSNNNLTSLDVSGCRELNESWCRCNKLTSLNIRGCKNLEILRCCVNELESLDVSGFSMLQTLVCSGNRLTTLNAGECTRLKELNCADNALTALDVSRCTSLKKLECDNNNLTSLNVNDCTELGNLDCSNNRLTRMDVSENTKLYLFFPEYPFAKNIRGYILPAESGFNLGCLAPSEFDAAKISSLEGGSISNSVFRFDEGSKCAKILYDGKEVYFVTPDYTGEFPQAELLGWNSDDTGSWYTDDNGNRLKGVSYIEEEELFYLFDENGMLLTGDENGDQLYNGNLYYINPERDLNRPETCYFVRHYKRVRPGIGITYYDIYGITYVGWVESIDDMGRPVKYYQTKVKDAEGKDLYIYVWRAQQLPEWTNPVTGEVTPAGVYLFGDDGVLETERGWYRNESWPEGDNMYYILADGTAATGVRYIDGKFYIFGDDGKLLTGDENGDQMYNGNLYYYPEGQRYFARNYSRVRPGVGVTYYNNEGITYVGWVTSTDTEGNPIRLYQTKVTVDGKDLYIYVWRAQHIPEWQNPVTGEVTPAGFYLFGDDGVLIEEDGIYECGDGHTYEVKDGVIVNQIS